MFQNLRLLEKLTPVTKTRFYDNQIVFIINIDTSTTPQRAYYKSITTGYGTGTIKQKLSDGIPNPQACYFYLGGTKNGSSISSEKITTKELNKFALHKQCAIVDFRYSSYIAQEGGLEIDKPVYLVFTYNRDNGLYYLADTWWTQTIPEQENDYIYMYIGLAISISADTNGRTYYMTFSKNHPLYYYKQMTSEDAEGIYPFSPAKYFSEKLGKLQDNIQTLTAAVQNLNTSSQGLSNEVTYEKGTGEASDIMVKDIVRNLVNSTEALDGAITALNSKNKSYVVQVNPADTSGDTTTTNYFLTITPTATGGYNRWIWLIIMSGGRLRSSGMGILHRTGTQIQFCPFYMGRQDGAYSNLIQVSPSTDGTSLKVLNLDPIHKLQVTVIPLVGELDESKIKDILQVGYERV